MGEAAPARRVLRFGAFEADLAAGELRKQGLKVRLQEKPFQVLTLLLERPGEVVTREELQQRLWPDTFVDFEHSLSTAIKKLRDALGDSADNPRFIETRPGRGYRFLYPVQGAAAPEAGAPPGRGLGARWVGLSGLVLGAVVALGAVLVALNVGGLRDRLLGRPAPGEITSIAVLPLENLSGDPEQDYFADGVTEALITELGKISALRVISRQSTMKFKDTDKPLPEIARELKVDALVEGAVVREGNRVRITAQLVQASPERHLWSETYERDLHSILALQGDVARTIAGEIRIGVTPQEEVRLASARPVNPEAHDAYLKGRYYLNKMTRATRGENGKAALEYLQQATTIDPGYALAYAGLADAYLERESIVEPPEAFSKAKAAATKALELDDTLAETHVALGNIMYRVDWDWSGAESHYRRAIELNPSYAEAHRAYSFYLSNMGHHEEALAEIERAIELDPLRSELRIRLAYGYRMARQPDQAIELARNLLVMEPNLAEAHSALAVAYREKEMYEQAIAERQEYVTLTGQKPGSDDAYNYAMVGRRTEALKILNDRKEEWSKLSPYLIGKIYWALGEKDQAFAWFERSYEMRESVMLQLKQHPFFDSWRSDPRFQDLLRRMNFPE